MKKSAPPDLMHVAKGKRKKKGGREMFFHSRSILLLQLLQPNRQQSSVVLHWLLLFVSAWATFGGAAAGQCRASCLLPHSRRYRPPITRTDPRTLHTTNTGDWWW